MISAADGGALLKVRVVPGAGRSEVTGEHDGRLRIRVAAPPEQGRANRELLSCVAGLFGLARGRVSILRGHGSREKTLLLAGLTADQARLKLRRMLSEE